MSDDWPVLDSWVDYECPWFTVGVDRVRRPDGETADYYWVDPGDAVAVVAVTEDDQLVGIEQYRPKLGERVRTLPAGIREDGESFARAGRRELREETGFDAGETALLDSVYVSSTLREEMGIVVASALTPGEQQTDSGEFIDVVRVPVESAHEWAKTGATTGWTLAALCIAAEEGLL